MSSQTNIPIIVNVYDLHGSNSMLHRVGTGFYHTGVEVNGYEYSFSESGVIRTRPRLSEFGGLREQITMGLYSGGMGGINAIISQLRNDTFQPGAYHQVHLNCNHFSEAFCRATVQASLPEYVNRLAQVGSNLVQRPAQPDANVKGLAAPGQVKSPEWKLGYGQSNSSTSSKGAASSSKDDDDTSVVSTVFSWLGWGSSTAGKEETPNKSNSSGSGDNSSSRNAIKQSDSSKKKELSQKQKELLAKMKSKS